MVAPSIRLTQTTGSYGSHTRLYLTDRHGNRLEEIPLASPTSGAISANEDTAPMRSLALDIAVHGVLRPFRDYVAPEVTLVYPDGSKDTATQGVYLVTGKRQDGDAARIAETIQGHDTTWHLMNTQVGAVSYPVGTDPGPACRALAAQAGFSAAAIDIPDTGRTLTTVKNPNPGTSVYAVMVDLLNAVDWYAPWLTWDFRLVSRPWIDTATAAVDVAFGAGTDRVITGHITSDPDYTRLRNAVTVRRIQQDQPPIWATARITNPAHPLYYDPLDPNVGLGYEKADAPIDIQDLPDAETAMEIAQSRLSDAATYYKPAKVAAVLDLRADMHQVVSLNFQTGKLAAEFGGRWLRRAWTMRLSGITALVDMDVYRTEDIQ